MPTISVAPTGLPREEGIPWAGQSLYVTSSWKHRISYEGPKRAFHKTKFYTAVELSTPVRTFALPFSIYSYDEFTLVIKVKVGHISSEETRQRKVSFSTSFHHVARFDCIIKNLRHTATWVKLGLSWNVIAVIMSIRRWPDVHPELNKF